MTDRIQAQCVVAPGQALLEIWRIDHTCYRFPFTHSPTQANFPKHTRFSRWGSFGGSGSKDDFFLFFFV